MIWKTRISLSSLNVYSTVQRLLSQLVRQMCKNNWVVSKLETFKGYFVPLNSLHKVRSYIKLTWNLLKIHAPVFMMKPVFFGKMMLFWLIHDINGHSWLNKIYWRQQIFLGEEKNKMAARDAIGSRTSLAVSWGITRCVGSFYYEENKLQILVLFTSLLKYNAAVLQVIYWPIAFWKQIWDIWKNNWNMSI